MLRAHAGSRATTGNWRAFEVELGAHTARVHVTDVHSGDMRPDQCPSVLRERRLAIAAEPWTWLRQVHGAGVLTVDAPGQHAGAEGDAAVTARAGVVLSVLTADCVPIAVVGDTGQLGVIHAGWRGLVSGVVHTACEALRGLGASDLYAVLGPCIRACCYEFGERELATFEQRFGSTVRARSRSGTPALDLPAAVRTALGEQGAEVIFDTAPCTGCSADLFSHRVNGTAERQAMVAWMVP